MLTKSIWTTLRGYGLTEAGTAGLMGNLRAESRLSSINVQDSSKLDDHIYTSNVDSGVYDGDSFSGDGIGYGFAQWTDPTRKRGLYQFAKQHGVSIGDEAMQLQYLMLELSRDYKDLYKYLQKTTDILTATSRVCKEFERPAVNNISVRYQYAMQIHKECLGCVPDAVEVYEYQKKISVLMPELKKGDKGLAVGMLQICLMKKGYDLGKFGSYQDGIDCDFGNKVDAAVKAFQEKTGLTVDGVVGAKTWEAVYE